MADDLIAGPSSSSRGGGNPVSVVRVPLESDGQQPSQPSQQEIPSSSQESPTKNQVIDERTIMVNGKQKGNPLIGHLRGLKVVYEDSIEADYIIGRGACIIFLSLKYHNLYPNYIYDKFKLVGQGYPLQVLLILVDISDPRVPLKELTKFCIYNGSTLMLCWSFEEAAKYVEYYKNFRNRPPTMLMSKSAANNQGTEGAYECVAEAIAGVKRVNKTDSISLISTFQSLEQLVKSPSENIALTPGLGPQKADALYKLFRKPFTRSA